MIKEKILINIENGEETEFALKRLIQNPVEVEFWSESKSGRHILAVLGASYVVFEKSADDGIASTPDCRYVGSTSMGPEEEDCGVSDILWRENGGCARILFRDIYEFNVRAGVDVIFNKEAYEFSERKFRTKNNDAKFLRRKSLVRSYLGKTVDILMDRPLGYVHEKEKYTLKYPINYGLIPGVIGGDGEELDVYLIGVDEPVSQYTAKIIGIVHRENDNEDKLIAAPEGMMFTKAEIEEKIKFQEKYYNSFVETEDLFFECSVKECFVDRKLPAELEHFLLNKLLCPRGEDAYRFPSWKEFDSLDEFKPYREKEESGDMDIYRPEFVCSPRTLFLALWRRYLRVIPDIPDDVKFNLKFSFEKGNLVMRVGYEINKEDAFFGED